MKKQLIVAGLATAVGVTGITGVGIASAATSTDQDSNTSLVDAIAHKFNLKTADVQSVFDEQRDQQEAAGDAEVAEELKQLVSDGKLTQAQADKLVAKRAEIEKEREAMRGEMSDKTHDEMKATMDAKRAELEQWATDNDIDTEYLRYVAGGHHGHGGFGPRGMRD